ncbi:MAG TPA: ion channel [Stellaceae bacterium]|nr:ion channel [Stellaceae bacterium]
MPRRQVRRRQTRRRPEVRFASAREARDLNRMPRKEFIEPDFYHRLLTISWPGFFLLIGAGYVVFNLVFALLYWLQDASIANARGVADAFFFSVQTMATIGYGEMHPATLYANVLVTIEVLLGLLGFALGTGVIFARISRPTARVMFSRAAVITDFDGVPTLMFRVANQRLNRILEAHVTVSLVRNELAAEGVAMRRFYELPVARERSPLFVLTWTVMHAIDKTSPLHGATQETLKAQGAELIVTLRGLDETFAQTIHARHNYLAEEILWQRRLVDIIGTTPDGRLSVDYSRFHDTADAQS